MADVATLDAWRPYICEVLGRDPRGLRDIVASDQAGRPSVIQVAAVVEGKPFPTLFWLIDPIMNLAIDRLEAQGVIAQLQARVNASQELRDEMLEDHRKHRALRDLAITTEERQFLEVSGMISAFTQRGIGGIKEPDRVRCLHTWYAAHCVEANAIGTLVDDILKDSNHPASPHVETS